MLLSNIFSEKFIEDCWADCLDQKTFVSCQTCLLYVNKIADCELS